MGDFFYMTFLSKKASKMRLQNISAGLRSGKLTIKDDLEGISFFVPGHLLHYFAVICANRALDKIPDTRRGEPLFLQAKDLIEKKKLWIEGRLSDQELTEFQDAYWSAYWNAYWNGSRSADFILYLSADSSADSSAYSSAYRSADFISYLSADSSADSSAYRSADWSAERAFQAIKLADLIDEYLEVLSSLTRVLDAISKKCRQSIQYWIDEGDDVLFS
jgi:hypothetical protein